MLIKTNGLVKENTYEKTNIKANRFNSKRAFQVGALIFLLILALSMVFLVGCKKNPPPIDENPILNESNIIFGAGTTEKIADIIATGGQIVIDDDTSSLDGLKVIQQNETYNQPMDYIIRSYPINSHKFGSLFNPITPIIEINNGHEFGTKPILVEIPITLSDGNFAMAFYYDGEEDALEAIPTVELSNNKIVIAVKHFSQFVVSDISLDTIQSLSLSNSVELDTGFMPGLDDWQYANYGSAIAPGGHCAGQSLTMAWYYSEKHIKEGQNRLYGSFDNNEEEDTEDFWLDDNNAYRFSSVIQNSIDFSSDKWIDFIDYCIDNPINTFYAFAYAIKVTNTPQLMAIFPSNGMGHAILAYKVSGNKIYVADPNYPGQTDRYVEFNPTTGEFLPYSSGANAADISDSGTVAYTNIVYAAKTALVDYDFMSKCYDQIENGLIGDDVFPNTNVEIMTRDSNVFNNILWSQVGREITLGSDYTDSLSDTNTGKAIIRLTPEYSNMVYSLYLGDNTTAEETMDFEAYEGSLYITLDLSLGTNEYAFLVEYYDGNAYSYIDFFRIRVKYIAATPSSTITFNSNGGTVVASITDEVGNSVNAPTAPNREGYVFGGWYKDQTFYEPYAFSVIPAANLTLYAKWIDAELLTKIPGIYYLYTVNGSKNLSTIEYQSYQVNSDNTYIETFKSKDDSDIITNTGTWSLTGDRLLFTSGQSTYEVIADGTYLKDLPSEEFYFIYKKYNAPELKITITFNSNGGSEVDSITQNAGSNLTKPANPIRSGYYFISWFTDSDLTTEFIFNKMPNNDVTLYAKWVEQSSTPGTYKLVRAYESLFATRPDLVTSELSEGDPFPSIAPSQKSGYIFLGYFTDSACTEPLNYTTMPAHDVYVYAGWQYMTEANMLGRYDIKNLESYLEYYYIEFLSGGICRRVYKYNSGDTVYTDAGTWTLNDRRSEEPYPGVSFSVETNSDPFPDSFSIYGDKLYSSRSGDWLKAE